MKAEQLKPCPFCGRNAKLMHAGPGCWFAQCQWCMANTNDGLKENAIAAWNRRAGDAK